MADCLPPSQTSVSERKIIVIGAGPAGLMAAITAACQGAKTILLEKMNAPAKKLLLTGNGRCNLTNMSPLSEFLTRYRPDGSFLRQSFSKFFSAELIGFFEELNVPLNIEPPEMIFPKSGKARDVANALLQKAGDCRVELITGSSVKEVSAEAGVFSVITTSAAGPDRSFAADAVIIATGGASYPQTGSTGDGYMLARSLGHTIISPRPALVPIKTLGDTARKLQGLSLRDVKISVFIDGKKQAHAVGEMLFTHYGLSGPVVLSLSGLIVDALGERKSASVSIDLIPALDNSSLDRKLAENFHLYGKQQIASMLKKMLPKRLVDTCLLLAEVSSDTICSQVTSGDRRKLAAVLKDFRLEVIGHLSFNDAIVTAGGVDTREIDPRTMASRLVKGLYFAGEVIDIDGDTGGYNLQAAFSTGFVAGFAAAKQSGMMPV